MGRAPLAEATTRAAATPATTLDAWTRRPGRPDLVPRHGLRRKRPLPARLRQLLHRRRRAEASDRRAQTRPAAGGPVPAREARRGGTPAEGVRAGARLPTLRHAAVTPRPYPRYNSRPMIVRCTSEAPS
ncbi:hypothetical protein [Catenulispora rubra]|uniref:hypothetical protein n=1 Tax=Catenulispora rubra TaxID=280293 RepID=UPI0034DDB737